MKIQTKSEILLLSSLLLLSSGCASTVKNIIHSIPQGQKIVKIFENNYKGERDFEPRINIIANPNYNSESKDVLFIVPGFASSPEKLGDIKNPDSALAIASKYFKGKILVADYVSKEKTLEISDKLFVELEKIVSPMDSDREIYFFAMSNGGNVVRKIVRENAGYVKRVSFAGSPLEGVNFGKYQKYLSENYPELLGMEKEELGDNIEELFEGSELFKMLNTPTEELGTEYIFNSFYSFFGDNFFVKGLDDSISPRNSSRAKNVRENNQFEKVKVIGDYLVKGAIHSSWLNEPAIIDFLFYTLKNGKFDLKGSSLEKRISILN